MCLSIGPLPSAAHSSHIDTSTAWCPKDVGKGHSHSFMLINCLLKCRQCYYMCLVSCFLIDTLQPKVESPVTAICSFILIFHDLLKGYGLIKKLLMSLACGCEVSLLSAFKRDEVRKNEKKGCPRSSPDTVQKLTRVIVCHFGDLHRYPIKPGQ